MINSVFSHTSRTGKALALAAAFLGLSGAACGAEAQQNRNLRVAVDQRLWELPAGTREPGEPAPETAARELEDVATTLALGRARLGNRRHVVVRDASEVGPALAELADQVGVGDLATHDAIEPGPVGYF